MTVNAKTTTLALAVASALLAPAHADLAQSTRPRYERRLLLETTSETSANASIGDVDGDGLLDIVLAKGRHWPLVDRVLLGDGRGGIRTSYDLGSASDRSYSGLLVDLDGDGALDVVISNDRPDPKRVYLNDGKGHFRVGSTFGRPEWGTRNASIADVNGDRLPDIIVANRGEPGAAYVCLNRGKGRFDADCIQVAGYPTTTVTPADFNHDGFVDLAVPHREGGQSYVYLGASKGGFSDSRRVPFGPPDATIRISAAADINSDGLIDLVAIDERTGVAVYYGRQDGGFGSAVPIGNPAIVPYALAVADLDGNGATDIIVGNVNAPSLIHFNNGAEKNFTTESFGDDQGTVYGFAIADLDRDGWADIAVARSEAPNVVYFGGPGAAQAPKSEITKLVEAELAAFPAKTGVYVKHLVTGEEIAVRADEAFSSASVIKIPILVRAFQMAEAKTLDLRERVAIGRAELRDGSGVLQYHDLGLTPTVHDLITQMVITSDNTATDVMTLKVGGVDRLNAWLASSGYPKIRMVGRGFEYRRKLLALLDPRFANITPEETTGLQYAAQGNPLFSRYASLFVGERAGWVEVVRNPANRRTLAANRDRLTVEDPSYWLGEMTPREIGRMLEAIEQGTIASKESRDDMKTIMLRQQAGARRIPHFLTVPVAHKTGDSGVIANDVGMIYARSGTIVIAFFVNGITKDYAETEDRIGRVSRLMVDYFDGVKPAP